MVNDPHLTATALPTAPARESSQSTLFDEHRLDLVRLGFLLTGSRPIAEELVQDAFEQVVRRWDHIDRPAGYLRTAVVNGARSWGRRKVVPTGDRGELVQIDQEAIAVRTALAALPHDQREVIVLRYFVGLSDTEIAADLDRPLGTVKSSIRRGLARMRKAFS